MTEPCAEAMEAALALVSSEAGVKRDRRTVALALDAFAAQAVQRERGRCLAWLSLYDRGLYTIDAAANAVRDGAPPPEDKP